MVLNVEVWFMCCGSVQHIAPGKFKELIGDSLSSLVTYMYPML